MDARFYNSEEIDIERLAIDLENIYRMQGFEAQHFGTKDQMMVQLKKGNELVALIGLQAALSVIIQKASGGVVAMIGQQKWVDKAAVGAVGLLAAPVLWPLMITAGAGAIRQASLGNQVLNVTDGLVHQQRPDVLVGPVPAHLMPQFQQQWAPPPSYSPPPQYTPPTPTYTPPTPVYTPPTPVYTPPAQSAPTQAAQPVKAPTPAPKKLRCPNCNTPYDAGDTFCSGCGRSLTPPKTLCPSCKTEIKPGVAFCPKCGSSVFQATQAVKPAPAPKPSTPVYTPPKPATPTYTPSSAPTMPAQPAPQPYVPPTPQEPPVVPQPSVTLIPGTPKPAAPQPPSQPQVPVYKPPVQPPHPQPVAPKGHTPPPPPAPIKARPASEPAADTHAPWGNLIFSDGTEMQLSGESVLVGRYDHDLGGVKPEIDLGNVAGSDTVSRAHATIEHIGSTYKLTDLNSTNSTRVNGKRVEPDTPTLINDGDTLHFGKVTCTFKKI